MVPLWTLVQTNLGPTPRNQPTIPSVLYINFSPVKIDEVSRTGAPGLTVDVDGDEVDMNRGCVCDEEEEVDGILDGDGWGRLDDVSLGLVCISPEAVTCFAPGVSGFCCVWIRVLTTSRGQVMTPAIPPAVVAVRISNPSPISLCPTQCLAYFCSCS